MLDSIKVGNFIMEKRKGIGMTQQQIQILRDNGIIEFWSLETAMKIGALRAFSYYCPDKKVWEETGYFNNDDENSFDMSY